jgi:hypothetical protein
MTERGKKITYLQLNALSVKYQADQAVEAGSRRRMAGHKPPNTMGNETERYSLNEMLARGDQSTLKHPIK